MQINQEFVDSIAKSNNKTVVVSGDSFENEAVAQNLMRVITEKQDKINSILLSKASHQVSDIIINTLISNLYINILLLQELKRDVLTYVLEFISSNENSINSLMFKAINAEDANFGLDFIAKNPRLSTLGLQHNMITEFTLGKIQAIPHIKTLGINAPDINTARLFANYEKSLANVSIIRLTATKDEQTIKTFVRTFGEKITSSYSEIKRVIDATLDEMKNEKISKSTPIITPVVNSVPETKESMKCETPPVIEKSIPVVPMEVPTENRQVKKPKVPVVDLSSSENTSFSSSSNENTPFNSSSRMSTPLQIFTFLNSVKPSNAETNEFEWQALIHQQQIEAASLQKHIKDSTQIQKRLTNLLSKFQNITHPNRKNDRVDKLDDARKEKDNEESRPTKKRKLTSEVSENKIYQQYTQVTETTEALETESLAVDNAKNNIFVELRKEIQALPNIKIGISNKTPETTAISEQQPNKILSSHAK